MLCLFCGSNTKKLHYYNHRLSSIQQFVRAYLTPTQYHYQCLLHLTANKIHLCHHCHNWKKNVPKKKRISTKTFSPIDHMIMHIIEPGEVQEPDHRCLKRLIQACMSATNPFVHIIPYHCQKIMQLVSECEGEELPKQIALLWFKFNNYTCFFRFNTTSRMVRRALRQDTIMSSCAPTVRWRH